jgi:translation initiation factor IF-1
MPKGSSKPYSSARFITPNKAGGEEETARFVDSNRMIQAAIAGQMEKHGIQIVEGNADLIIAHLIIFQDNISTSYSNQYFGYQDFSKLVDLAHKKGVTGQNPEAFQKRALVIDLIDAKTFKLVYRDYSVAGTLANLSEKDRQAQINKAVAETLQKFFK